MAEPIMPWDKPHDEAEALLPWYATGRLDASDRARVEKHLSTCSGCREQLGLERRLIHEFRAFAPEVESGWARLRARVASPVRSSKPGRSIAELGAELWAALTRPVVVALAAAQLAFVTFASVLLMWLSQPAYHALGSAPAPAPANAIIMFRADATVNDMRDAIRGAGASVIGGPTAAGAYLLHVDPRQRSSALAKLRADDNVQMAEQIDGRASP